MTTSAWIRQKGPGFEKAVSDYLTSRGIPTERRVKEGKNDRGDIAGLIDAVMECKATKAIDLAAARKEAITEAANAGVTYPFTVHKKRQANVKDAYVEMPLWAFVDLYLAVHGKKEVA